MKTKIWSGARQFSLVCTVLCLAAWRASAQLGQSVLAPPPANFAGQPSELQTAGTNEPGRAVFAVPEATAVPVQPLLAFGEVEFHPHFLYRFLYGNQLQAVPGERSNTALNQVYPGVTIFLGPHWSFDYTPTLSYYSSSHFRDTLEHSIALSGTAAYRDWNFGLSQSCTLTEQPLVETASQTEQETYATTLSAVCQLSSALSLDLGANQTFSFLPNTVAGQPLSDSRVWSTTDWLNYRLTPGLSAGLGVGFGYDNISVGTDMTHEQFEGRLDLRTGEKLTFMASGGFEDRQYLGSSLPDSINPLFAVSAQYAVFAATILNLNVNRTVGPSLFTDQTTVSTTVSGGITQRLFGKARLSFSGGYFSSSYSSTSVGLSVDREDKGLFASVSLGVTLLKRGTASVFYQVSHNSSNQGAFGYSSSQGGLELGYRF